MKNTSWKDIAELIGIAAIVASLIFVGLQMRQDQEIAIAEVSQSSLEAIVQINNDINSHADIWVRGSAGAKLDAVDSVIFENLVFNLRYRALVETRSRERLGLGDFAEAPLFDFARLAYQNPGVREEYTHQFDARIQYATAGAEPLRAVGFDDRVKETLDRMDREEP